MSARIKIRMMNPKRWVTLSTDFKVKRFGRFAVHLNDSAGEPSVRPHDWKVTHLASGYSCGGSWSYRDAVSLAKKLDALDIDMSFTDPKGEKWVAAKPVMKAVVDGMRKR